MKKWIKKINNDSLNHLFKKSLKLNKTPSHLDEKISDFFDQEKINFDNKKLKIGEKKIFLNPYVLFRTAAITAVILIIFIPVSIFILKKDKKPVLIVNSFSGNVIKSRDNYVSKIEELNLIDSNDSLITQNNSKCEIQYNKNIILLVDEKSELFFPEKHIDDKSINVDLKYGRIFVNIENRIKNYIFQVDTSNATIIATGTKFIVESNNNIVTVSCKEGELKIKLKNTYYSDKKIIIKNNDQITIDNKNYKISKIEPEKTIIFDTFNNLSIKKSSVEHLTDIKTLKENQLNWKWKNIYNFNYKYDNTKNSILGLISYDNFIIAQTEVSIICFDSDGRLLWIKEYGKEKNIFFMSMPFVHDEKIFLSSVNKIFLILDLKTGNEIKKIKTNGNISFGYRPALFEENLLIPYGHGIYKLKLDNLNIIPFINFNNPKSPVFMDNDIIISSFVSNDISCFNRNGEKKWSSSLDQASFNIPLIINNNIFIGDNSGVFYLINNDGKLVKKNILPGGIISKIISDKNNDLYILLNDGFLYKINSIDLSYEILFKIDDKPDISDYLFKSFILSENKIISGTNNGEIIIFDLNKKAISEILNIANSPVSSLSYIKKGLYFIGTKTGKIFILKEDF